MIFFPAGRFLTLPRPPDDLAARLLAAVIRPPLLFFAIYILSLQFITFFHVLTFKIPVTSKAIIANSTAPKSPNTNQPNKKAITEIIETCDQFIDIFVDVFFAISIHLQLSC